MESQIKAVIFDYGIVLCEPQPPGDMDAMAAILGLDPAEFQGSYWRDRREYDEAGMTPEEYWKRIAGREVAADQVKKLNELDCRSWLHPRQQTLAWVPAVKRRGLRTALLSNMPATLRVAINACPWLPAFDAQTFSCDVKKSKPDREIFDDIVRKLGVKPFEAVLVDDRVENVKGANAVGMHGVVFETAAQAAHDLATQWNVSVQ